MRFTGEVEMLKSITQVLLTSVMGLAWDAIELGERVVAVAEGWEVHEGNEQSAGFVEVSVWRAGRAIVSSGEHLVLFINSLGVKLGYGDGEVAGWVLDQCQVSAILTA
jgi:hypothetical protein